MSLEVADLSDKETRRAARNNINHTNHADMMVHTLVNVCSTGVRTRLYDAPPRQVLPGLPEVEDYLAPKATRKPLPQPFLRIPPVHPGDTVQRVSLHRRGWRMFPPLDLTHMRSP